MSIRYVGAVKRGRKGAILQMVSNNEKKISLTITNYHNYHLCNMYKLLNYI